MINQKKARLYNSKIIDDLFKKDKDALDIPVNAARIFKPIIFKKIPKKEDGRCINFHNFIVSNYLIYILIH